MPKIVDEAEQRTRIRDAARRVFSARGVATTGLAHVAAEAGMRRSNLYHYYPDKAAIVRDLANEVLAEEEALFRAAVEAEGNALDRVERLFTGVSELLASRASMGRLLIETWVSDAPRVRRVMRRVRAALAEVVEAGQRRGEITADLEPEAAAVVLVGLMDGLLVQVFLDPRGLAEVSTLPSTVLDSVRRLLRP
jgi:AcrR family transcriptional regulator